MDKNNSDSSTSVCTKIRQALGSNPAVRAVQRITSFSQDPKPITKDPNSKPSITDISIQSKPYAHHKTQREGSGAIPINFYDHSAPKLREKGVAKGGSSVRTIKVATKGEPHSMQHGHGVQITEPQGNKPMDINDHFKVFIQQTREKMMRSMSNIGWTHHSNHPAAAPDREAHGINENESHFSEFIHRAKKKLRTTTTVRRNNYSKKE
ncbi:hypothetical protein VNO78_20833 [Psophocarpus tetragonolobus]|uniref:Uncharacterized protein n=1 Tax=Psophocarpus tetragonolobus TaxID=3891 RepID=A0AAN9XHH7_PSOTE